MNEKVESRSQIDKTDKIILIAYYTLLALSIAILICGIVLLRNIFLILPFLLILPLVLIIILIFYSQRIARAMLEKKVVESKANRIITMAYLGMMLLAIPVVIFWYSFSLYSGYHPYAWMFYLMFFITPGIPLAIIMMLMIFREEITKMKCWKKISIFCCSAIVLAGIIFVGVVGWVLVLHFS